MKITKRPSSIIGGKAIYPIPGADVRERTETSTAGNVDQLQIAPPTSQLQELQAQLAMLDIADTAKVEAVKLAIDSGSFKVNSEVVADQLIDSAKEAVRKRPRK